MMSALQMDFSATRFQRLNSQSVKVTSPSPSPCASEAVAIDYSKSSSRMSPEGHNPSAAKPTSVRVPTKGMRKAYPEDQYKSSPKSCQPSQEKLPTVSSASLDLPGKMENPPYTHPSLHYPPMGNHDHSPASSYYPTPPPPTFSDHHNIFANYNYDPNPNEESIREYHCMKCGLIFSRESDLHIHYSQDHGYGHVHGGGSSAGGGSNTSSSSSGSGNLLPNNRGQHQNNSRNSSLDMFCDKCQLRFHCLLSFRVHQHEHVLPNVQPHYPMSNSHLLSLSYSCEICGANFMSRESLTEHANAHLFEHVCSESTCGESDGGTTNSSEDFYHRGMANNHNQQIHHSYQRGGYLEMENEDNSPVHQSLGGSHTHNDYHNHHNHENTEHQLGRKAEDSMIVNQGPNIYSPEYSSPPYHHPPTHDIPPPHPSSKTSTGGVYEPLIVMDNGKRRFQCVICKKYLSSRIAHEEHTRGKHTGDKPYSCTHCGKRFAVWNTYKHHMGTHKGGITPLQKCSLCEKRFKTVECLRNHMQREHHNGTSGSMGGGQDSTEGSEGSGGYSCQICGKTFVRKMWRTRHYLSHAGQNCFRCELCSCILPDEQSYRMHHESHKGSN